MFGDLMNIKFAADLYGDLKDWAKQPYRSNGDLMDWILFIGLLVIASYSWSRIVKKVITEL